MFMICGGETVGNGGTMIGSIVSYVCMGSCQLYLDDALHDELELLDGRLPQAPESTNYTHRAVLMGGEGPVSRLLTHVLRMLYMPTAPHNKQCAYTHSRAHVRLPAGQLDGHDLHVRSQVPGTVDGGVAPGPVQADHPAVGVGLG